MFYYCRTIVKRQYQDNVKKTNVTCEFPHTDTHRERHRDTETQTQTQTQTRTRTQTQTQTQDLGVSLERANYLQGKNFEFSIQKLSNLLAFAL